jgi:hypothetical protein
MRVADGDVEVENMPTNGASAPQQGNHAPLDYQRQIMLIEQENKIRLLRVRALQEQDNQSGRHQQRDSVKRHERSPEPEYGEMRYEEDRDRERRERAEDLAAVIAKNRVKDV